MVARSTTIGLLVLMAAVAAQADELRIETLKYANVTVIGVEDSELIYRVQGGKDDSRRLVNSITQIALADRDDFNAGEASLVAGELEAAFKSYDRALALASEAWLKQLIRYRQLLAYERNHQIDRALELWRRLCRPEKSSENAMAMMPGVDAFGEPGSLANSQAISGLLLDRPDTDMTSFDRAVTKLLLDLYKHEGDDEAASREAARLAGQPIPGGDGEPGDGPTDGPGGQALSERLSAATVLMTGDTAAGWAQAIDTINADLHEYPEDMLAEALLVLGLATRKQADAATEDPDAADGEARTLLLEAGIHLMYVATFFPESPEAAEALFETGRINEAIGNVRAARQAYAAVQARYGHLDMAEKAAEALRALDTKTD